VLSEFETVSAKGLSRHGFFPHGIILVTLVSDHLSA
jgi:hypothetical protein